MFTVCPVEDAWPADEHEPSSLQKPTAPKLLCPTPTPTIQLAQPPPEQPAPHAAKKQAPHPPVVDIPPSYRAGCLAALLTLFLLILVLLGMVIRISAIQRDMMASMRYYY